MEEECTTRFHREVQRPDGTPVAVGDASSCRPLSARDMPPPAHVIANTLLQACEEGVARGSLASTRFASTRWGRVTRWLLPLELSARSAAASIGVFIQWGLAVLAIAAIANGLVQPIGLVSEVQLDGFVRALWILVTICALLSLPSVLGFSGWNAVDLQATRERFPTYDSVSGSNIEAVQYFVDYAIARIKQRIAVLWWITGIAWAIAIYLGQKGLDAKDGSMLGSALIPLLIAGLCAGLLVTWSRAVDQVHGFARSLLFERHAALAAQASDSSSPPMPGA